MSEPKYAYRRYVYKEKKVYTIKRIIVIIHSLTVININIIDNMIHNNLQLKTLNHQGHSLTNRQPLLHTENIITNSKGNTNNYYIRL